MGENTVTENNYIDPSNLEQREKEAIMVTSNIRNYFHRLHYIDLQPHTPEEYYDTLKDWGEFKPFKEPKIRDAYKDAGITFGLRVKALFSSDAKAELEKKSKDAEAIHENDIRLALDRYQKCEKRFCDKQNLQHKEVEERHRKMRSGDVEQIEEYFEFVLQQDSYSTDLESQFLIDVADLQYDEVNKKLSFAYRIPNKEEILTFSSFVYDREQDEILPKSIDEKHQSVQRNHIMHRVLLRPLIMIYSSDLYGFINDVEITGFLEYYDPAYGTRRRKNVVIFHMSRDEFLQTDFEKVNVESLYSQRLKAKESSGLYSKEPKEILGIDTTKRKTNSKNKK